MILCSCTVITRGDLTAEITQVLRDDPYAVITPGRLFHRLGRRMACARCAPLIQSEIARALADHGRPVPNDPRQERPA